MTTEGSPPLRIGNAERTAAMKALDEHLAAGRLNVEEYADRSATAANATVASELSALFTDLPAPHPDLPGAPPPPSPTAPLPAVPEKGTVASRASGAFEIWKPRIMGLTPFIAGALFFTIGGWWWWLLIPVMGILLYGGDHDHGHGRERKRRERRDRD
jgi:hypothetical protein